MSSITVVVFHNDSARAYKPLMIRWELIECGWKVLIHTYILNWPLQTFSQDNDLVSHATYIMCVNFIHELRDLQDFYLLSEFLTFCQNLLIHLSFWCPRGLNRGFKSNKSTYNPLNYGDIKRKVLTCYPYIAWTIRLIFLFQSLM